MSNRGCQWSVFHTKKDGKVEMRVRTWPINRMREVKEIEGKQEPRSLADKKWKQVWPRGG